MSNKILTLGDALNYLGTIGGLVASMVACVYVLARVGESWGRSACKRRHPASVGRRARIVAQRRARLDGRGR
jgi:hypothetical protein